MTRGVRYAYFASLGERQMAFYVGGVNYVTKMTTDLRFLPAPSQQDPLLLFWFSEQLPWLLSSDPVCNLCASSNPRTPSLASPHLIRLPQIL